jgi:hypothetical protein
MAGMVVTHTEPPHEPPGRAPDDRSLRERGQATVEVVALLPILALAAVALGQTAVAGWTAWSAAGAARVSARAHALGEDPEVAARSVLPAMLARRATVTVGDSGGKHADRTTVRLKIPALLPGVRMGSVSSSSELPDQAGA